MNQLRDIKVIIWDLDGALVHTLPDLVESFRVSAREVGYGELTEEQTQNKVGGGAVKAFQRMFGEEGAHFVEPAVEFFKQYYPNHAAEYSTLYPGVLDVLDKFDGKIKFAMATAKIRSASLKILEKLQVDKYFEYVVAAEDMQRMKPDPQSVEMVIDHFGVDPKQVVMIGDMKTDVMAAHGAGAYGIGVSYGYGKLEDLESVDPEFIVDDASKLLDLITWEQ